MQYILQQETKNICGNLQLVKLSSNQYRTLKFVPLKKRVGQKWKIKSNGEIEIARKLVKNEFSKNVKYMQGSIRELNNLNEVCSIWVCKPIK